MLGFAETSGRFPAENSPYLRFIQAERDEIQRVKWLESERLGGDCGHDYAVWVWSMRHRSAWISGMKERGLYPGT